jgi:hypothetical protein
MFLIHEITHTNVRVAINALKLCNADQSTKGNRAL